MEKLRDNLEVLAAKYLADFSLPIELARIIARRFPEYSKARDFLYPDINQLFAPDSLPDINKASGAILKALRDGEDILIYCHDDPDGYTSAIIMYKTLLDLRRSERPAVYIYPIIREKDGYILNPEVLKSYKEKGAKLLITVDFGISNEENFRIARELDLRLVVCDHHKTNQTQFSVPAVDPKRTDSKYPFYDLAGVGVVFKLCQFIYQQAFNLQPREFYGLKKEFLALSMLGTVADRVPMFSENRILCVHGLRAINEIDTPWLKFFKKNGDIDIARVNLEIIPLLGSASSIHPQLGIELLLHEDEKRVVEIVEKLKISSERRKKEIDSLSQEAIAGAQIYPRVVISIVPLASAATIAGGKLHYLGAVSSRLRDHFHRPAVVIGIKDRRCFGELRSYSVDLYEMLHSMKELFIDYGGHKRAAGFSMREEYLDRFISQIDDYTQRFVVENCVGVSEPETFLDKSKISILGPLMPFGEGNPAPILTDGVDVYTIDNNFNIIELD